MNVYKRTHTKPSDKRISRFYPDVLRLLNVYIFHLFPSEV